MEPDNKLPEKEKGALKPDKKLPKKKDRICDTLAQIFSGYSECVAVLEIEDEHTNEFRGTLCVSANEFTEKEMELKGATLIKQSISLIQDSFTESSEKLSPVLQEKLDEFIDMREAGRRKEITINRNAGLYSSSLKEQIFCELVNPFKRQNVALKSAASMYTTSLHDEALKFAVTGQKTLSLEEIQKKFGHNEGVGFYAYGCAMALWEQLSKAQNFIEKEYRIDWISDKKENVHAEMKILNKILLYLNEKKIQKGYKSGIEFYIGISKSCCYHCNQTLKAAQQVLSGYGVDIAFRDAHDVSFEKNWQNPSLLRETKLDYCTNEIKEIIKSIKNSVKDLYIKNASRIDTLMGAAEASSSDEETNIVDNLRGKLRRLSFLTQSENDKKLFNLGLELCNQEDLSSILDTNEPIVKKDAHRYFNNLVICLIEKHEKEQNKKPEKEQVKELYSFFKKIRFQVKEIYHYYDESVLNKYLSKEEISGYLQSLEKESVIDIDQTLKKLEKNNRSSKEEKTKQYEKTINEKAIEANQGGSDIDLAGAGQQDPHYPYSIKDFICILSSIRKDNFTYENAEKSGESFSELRENKDKLLLVDPYWAGSFEISLKDTVSRITGDKNDQSSNVKDPKVWQWGSMPESIIIPVNQGFHWRVVRIKINYETKEADVLFDDPYGKGGFSESLKGEIINSLEDQLPRLFEKRFEKKEKYDLKIIANEKTVDQQGRGTNSWDCGPICLRNISDYVNVGKSSKSNQDFSNDSNDLFTIKQYGRKQEKPIEQIRVEDIALYLKVSEGGDLDEKRKQLIFQNFQAKNTFDYKKTIKQETGLSEYCQNVNDKEIAEFLSSVFNYCTLLKKDQNLLNKSELDEIYFNTFGAPKVNLQDQVMELTLKNKELVEMLKKQQEEIASLKALLMQKKETEDTSKNTEQGDGYHDQPDLSRNTPLLLSKGMKRKSLTSHSSSTVNVSPDMQIQTHSEHAESAELSNDTNSNIKQKRPK